MKTGNNTKILMIVSVVLLIAFSGCTAKNEQVVKTSTGVVNVSGGVGTDWCKSGTVMKTTGPGGKEISYTIKGITTYEGKEVCESGWNSSEGSYTIYMNQDKTYNILIMKDNTGKETRFDMSQPKK